MKIQFELTGESEKIVNMAIADSNDDATSWVLELVNKTLEQKKIAFARQRLNRGKVKVAELVNKNFKGFESLEQAYISMGMSNDVDTYGGIRKVFEDIYQKSGVHVNATQIRLANLVVVNPPKVG